MLTKEQKLEQAEQLRADFGAVKTLFLLENTGLTVNEVNELRSKVRKAEGTYKVVKNSVTRLAIEGTPLAKIDDHLKGPNALAFTTGDPVALAKVLREFIKAHAKLAFKEAFLEGQLLSSAEAPKIADMPSREELVSKLLYLLQSPIRRLAVALNAPIQNLTSVMGQVADQKKD
jgi:large subunit ribosomal protein L10